MRPIKFRAWHKEEKRFVSLWAMGWRFESENGQVYVEGMNVTNRVVLQQYTGLTDRNEKEIYEGDIIRFNWMEDQDIGVVAFVDGCFKVTQMKRHIAVPLFIRYPTHEVIGNIYEHPHLLEKEVQNG